MMKNLSGNKYGDKNKIPKYGKIITQNANGSSIFWCMKYTKRVTQLSAPPIGIVANTCLYGKAKQLDRIRIDHFAAHTPCRVELDERLVGEWVTQNAQADTIDDQVSLTEITQCHRQ